jgi:glycerol uptake facilitator-like aquaporin
MNPARSLAPALISWTWDAQWLYVVGPVAGALAGALVYASIRDAQPMSREASDARHDLQ